MPLNQPGSSTDRRARYSVRLGGFCFSLRFKPAQVPVVDIDGGHLATAVAAAIESKQMQRSHRRIVNTCGRCLLLCPQHNLKVLRTDMLQIYKYIHI